MSCGTVSGFETPLVRAYAVEEGVTRERKSDEAATRRKSDRQYVSCVSPAETHAAGPRRAHARLGLSGVGSLPGGWLSLLTAA
jgi:hypothetical protein